MKKYDFIGDVHGRFSKLVSLLEKAGYVKDKDGDYYHPEGRIAFFLGDIIDKGNNVFETFFLVKKMVEKGYAKIIIGNHELNFIAIHIYHNNEPLRKRTKSKLKQIENSLELLKCKKEVFEFIYKIPFYYEDEHVRAVHACWHEESLLSLDPFLNDKKQMIGEASYIKAFNNKKCFDAIEKVLKGLEIDINPSYYKDKNGEKRTACRLNWWEEKKDLETVPDNFKEPKNIKSKRNYLYSDDKKVFFGHYTKEGKPYIQSKNALCLDFCREGYLTMYRYNEGEELSKENLLYL